MHQVFHVAVLVAFLAAIAVAFLGVVAPILFGDRTAVHLPGLRVSLVIGVLAAAVLAFDWIAHNFL
ncbi:MAG TPA: hypothetical protein VND22_09625 [Actinomycetota bacterium]|nr:hypothetical protein [Actinomycetota bacterium]